MAEKAIETPVYVYAPPWRNNAAGVKVLYLLCDLFNRKGLGAWIVLASNEEPEKVPPHLSKLQTPILDESIFNKHKIDGKKPIVVYSETVPGNPLNSSKVVRYFLHFPGALLKRDKYNQNEFKLAYTASIKDALKSCSNVLYLPAVELEELPQKVDKVKGYCVGYAGKYRLMYGKPKLPANIVYDEIWRDGPKRQSREVVLNMLAKAETLYLWENSSIAVEAQLLGTAVVFVPTKHLGPLIADQELGWFGTAMTLSDYDLRLAHETVKKFGPVYEKARKLQEIQFELLIKDLSTFFENMSNREIQYPEYFKSKILSPHKLKLALALIVNRNPLVSLRVLRSYFFKYIWKQKFK